jgi:secondary thiamine-phosphate synthase enzyme
MRIINKTLKFNTGGNPDLINITDEIGELLAESKLKNGILTVFVIGSTAAIATFEYEPGLVRDMQGLYEKLIPKSRHYDHDDTWGDANGFSHLRAAIQGPSLTIPFTSGKLSLGTWQQIVLAEFDNRSRERHVAVQIMGE